jgi:hypothetical protein
MYHFLYLIQTAEDLYTNIYKIGKTEQLLQDRFNGYDKGSYPIRISLVDDCSKRETELREIFNKKFKLNRGNEFFEGDIEEMIYEFSNLCNQKKIIKNTLQKSDIIETDQITENSRKIKKYKNHIHFIDDEYFYIPIMDRKTKNYKPFNIDRVNKLNKKELLNTFIAISKQNHITGDFTVLLDYIDVDNKLLNYNLKHILLTNELTNELRNNDEKFKINLQNILLNHSIDIESKVELISKYNLIISYDDVKTIITSDIELDDVINIIVGYRYEIILDTTKYI